MSVKLYINDRADETYDHALIYKNPINVIATTFVIDDGSRYAYRVSFNPVTAKFTIQDLNSTNYSEVRMINR